MDCTVMLFHTIKTHVVYELPKYKRLRKGYGIWNWHSTRRGYTVIICWKLVGKSLVEW